MKRIFLSYRHGDGKKYMKKVETWLVQNNYDVKTDEDWVLGANFEKKMKEESEKADLVLAIRTPSYLNSPNTGYELIYAKNENKLVEILCEEVSPFYPRDKALVLDECNENEFIKKIDEYFKQISSQQNSTQIKHPTKKSLNDALINLHDYVNQKSLMIKTQYGKYVKLESEYTKNELDITFMIGDKIDHSVTLYVRKLVCSNSFGITSSDNSNRSGQYEYSLSDDEKTLESVYGLNSESIFIENFGEFFYDNYINSEFPD